MFPIIRARWESRKLARKLRTSLATADEEWKVDSDEEQHAALSNRNVRIVLVPRVARLLDAIHVYSDKAEIWFPLLPRLRLRGAARLRLIQDANEHWKMAEQTKAHAAT